MISFIFLISINKNGVLLIRQRYIEYDYKIKIRIIIKNTAKFIMSVISDNQENETD